MQFVKFAIDGGDTIIPNYSCGLKDKTVWLHYHGSEWATWKLIDQAQKHFDKCLTCRNREHQIPKEDDDLLKFFQKLAKEQRELTDVFAQAEASDQAPTLKIERLANLLLDAMAESIVRQVLGAVEIDEEAAAAEAVDKIILQGEGLGVK